MNELRPVTEPLGVRACLIFLDVSEDLRRERKEKNKITNERHDLPSAWLIDDAALFELPTDDENPIVYRPDIDLNEWFESLDLHISTESEQSRH